MTIHSSYITGAFFIIVISASSLPRGAVQEMLEASNHEKFEESSTLNSGGSTFHRSKYFVSPILDFKPIRPKDPQNLPPIVAKLMNKFITQIKLFSTEEGFNAEEFFTKTSGLSEIINYIGSWMKICTPSEYLLNQFTFAKIVFRHLQEDAGFLLAFQTSKELEKVLISNLIRLNIRLLGFYNLSGEPDVLLDNFTTEVYRHMRILHFQNQAFQELKNTLLHDQQLFTSRFFEAKTLLQTLASCIPAPLALAKREPL